MYILFAMHARKGYNFKNTEACQTTVFFLVFFVGGGGWVGKKIVINDFLIIIYANCCGCGLKFLPP